VIVLAVRWYLRFGLSYRDLKELLAERGVEVDHVTIYRWVQRFTPLLVDAARPCRHAVGDRWQVDETYVKVAGQWRYVYRAIDQFGQVIDVFVSRRRNITAARRFLERAIGVTKVMPVEITSDQAPVYPPVLEELGASRSGTAPIGMAKPGRVALVALASAAILPYDQVKAYAELTGGSDSDEIVPGCVGFEVGSSPGA
jgi:transposase-like protein